MIILFFIDLFYKLGIFLGCIFFICVVGIIDNSGIYFIRLLEGIIL